MSIGEANAGVPLRELLADIAQAWRREWVLLAKEVLARLWPPETPLTSVAFAEDAVRVRRPGMAGETRVAADPESSGISVVSALRRELAGAGPVHLVFDEGEILRPVLQFPKASAKVMRKALYFELAHLSPVPPDRLYFDFTAQPRSEGSHELSVRLRAIRRAAVNGALAKCHAAGLQVAGIRLGDDTRAGDWRVFPVDRAAFLRTQWERFQSPALVALAGCLALVLLIALYARGSASLADLSAQIEAERTRASVVEQFREKVASLSREQTFLVAQKQKPLVVATFAELTRLLPDDTWITDLQLAGRKVHLQGYSKSASRLIGRISSSGHFANAQFQSPLTQDRATGASRFDLSFEVIR